jgi:hypothetical protein
VKETQEATFDIMGSEGREVYGDNGVDAVCILSPVET